MNDETRGVIRGWSILLLLFLGIPACITAIAALVFHLTGDTLRAVPAAVELGIFTPIFWRAAQQ